MIEYFFKKYSEKIEKNFIRNLFNTLNEIKNVLSHTDDLEEQMVNYINLELLEREINSKINGLKSDLDNISMSKYSIINKQILKKRKEGKLISDLRKMDDKDLFELKGLVDIEDEVRIVENENYEKMKENRRNNSHTSYTIGGNVDKGVLL